MPISETEARELLQAKKIERDILETRSCAKIVEELGLLAVSQIDSIETAESPVQVIEV